MKNTISPKLNKSVPLILLFGDALALLIFIILGQLEHQTVDLWRALLQLVLFGLPWLVAGWLLGAFPTGQTMQLRVMLLRAVNAWFVAAPLGLMLRAFALNRPAIPAIFMLATYGLGAIFVLGWRLIFAWTWKNNYQ